jgi:hypothetical protein
VRLVWFLGWPTIISIPGENLRRQFDGKKSPLGVEEACTKTDPKAHAWNDVLSPERLGKLMLCFILCKPASTPALKICPTILSQLSKHSSLAVRSCDKLRKVDQIRWTRLP